MPQFDFYSFFVQILWLTLFSFTFYLIYLKMPLNNSSQVLKMRMKLKNFALTKKEKSTTNFITNSFLSSFSDKD